MKTAILWKSRSQDPAKLGESPQPFQTRHWPGLLVRATGRQGSLDRRQRPEGSQMPTKTEQGTELKAVATAPENGTMASQEAQGGLPKTAKHSAGTVQLSTSVGRPWTSEPRTMVSGKSWMVEGG